ncbi:MAG: Mrp/NBP35 family ATP-binding protein [Firmicutes bacterium]|nr:Mrp/NBP35 family ATP-binding protein [Bacillota bacterium]
MSENCDHNCANCKMNCPDDRKKALDAMKVMPGAGRRIKHVIGVVSGKGGVGKSMVTSMLAVEMNRRGYKTAVLDADITGPSIPRIFGIKGKAEYDGSYFYPIESRDGIKVMSINLLLDKDTDAVLWRGPVIAGVVKQFWAETDWEDLDYMFVDMPPGTGDVPLTVFQTLPLDGVVLVTSPQQLVGMIVEKAAVMAAKMYVPILAIVENMSYFTCPDCGKQYHIFGESHLDEISAAHGIELTAAMPIDPSYAQAADSGSIEDLKTPALAELAEMLEKR